MLKLNFLNSPNWSFHRSGWNYVSSYLKSRYKNIQGISFYEWADGEFRDHRSIDHPWIGILHNVISYPPQYSQRKDIRILCLRDLIKQDFFIRSMKNCLLLFTLSKNTSSFLKSNGFQATPLTHPATALFEWESFGNQIISVGQWMRKIDSISKLQTDFKKIILKVPWQEPYDGIDSSGIEFVDYKSPQEYDELLSRSVVYIHMYDVAACNTMLECIMSNTPILTNRLKGSEEYLGEDYPLFYDSMSHAACLLEKEKILMANNYLKNKDKSKFSVEFFCAELDRSMRKSLGHSFL